MLDLNDLSAYNYVLPEELIATKPAYPRGSSRLMCVRDGEISHWQFGDLGKFLKPNDLLVVNDVAVQRARFFAQRKSGGRVEVLLTQDLTGPGRSFTCLWKARRRVLPDEVLVAQKDHSVQIQLWRDEAQNPGEGYVRFLSTESVMEILGRIGELALPPYIVKRRQVLGDASYEAADDTAYQTVYAREGAAVAAPTAGLHFTLEQIQALRAQGVEFGKLRLDVGPGTFQPIRSADLNAHHMHSEHYTISQELVDACARCHKAGGRIFAVGTTVVRSLEDQARRFGHLQAGSYDTDIFIKPGYAFKMVDAMVTNFHLPGSTLMVLVSAFAGHEPIFRAYAQAIEEHYRFYSYGDAMLLFRA